MPANWIYGNFKKPDFERLLQAEELKDYVRWRNNEGKAEYAAKSTPRIAHICAEVSKAERFSAEKYVFIHASLVAGTLFRNQKHDERKYAKACDPAFQAEIIEVSL